MTIPKADERWLACLDRALASFGHLLREPEEIIERANAFYDALPTNRPTRSVCLQRPADGVT